MMANTIHCVNTESYVTGMHWAVNGVCAAIPTCRGQVSVTAHTQDGMTCQLILDATCK